MSPALVAETPGGMTKPGELETCIRDILNSITKTALDPSLTASDIGPNRFDALRAPIEVDDYHKTAVETAHKTILYEIAISQDLDDGAVQVAFGNLLDCALICSELDIADVGLPFTLLEELFDTQTIPSCERLFNYLESRVERLTVGMDGGKGKALILLRLCNELLRRLSKAEDTIFCGRILIFLSKSFPISERSAVNLRGDFNVENVTIFDDIPDQPQDETDPMEVDTNTNGAKAAGGTKESDTKSEDTPRGSKSVSFTGRNQPLEQHMSADKLYVVFWSLQHDFADPTRLFVPENFQRFKNGLEATMLKFRQANVEAAKIAGVGGKQYVQGSASKGGDKRTTGAAGAAGAAMGEKRKREDESPDELRGEGFNPKYLTSRELFELEICDLTFRRNVLVQAMILLDFLLGLTPAAKEKWVSLQAPNRSVQYAFTLGAEDEAWTTKTKMQISESLSEDQQGRLFMRLINTVLTREQNWVHWKAEGCHKFDLLPVPTGEFLGAKNKALNHCKPERPFPYVMGTPTLNRLWQDTGKRLKLDNLVEEGRYRTPSFDSFREGVDKDLEDLKDAMFPSDIEECHNAVQTKTWKGLRLAAQSRLHLFNKFDDRLEETRNDLKMLADVEDKASEELKAKANQQAQQGQVPQVAKAST